MYGFDEPGVGVVIAAVAVAAASFAAALRILHDYGRIERRAAELEHSVEDLQDRMFRIADSEERHRSLIEAQGDIIIRRDAADQPVYVNEAYSRLAGTTARLDVLERSNLALRPDGSRTADERVRTPDGERWIAWIETPLASPEGRPEMLRVGRDITDRVASACDLEEARRRAEAASDAKTRFLANVSHEIRTPLNGILGMAELLSDTAPTPEQATYVSAIATSGETLLSLIDGILDVSRIEAGRIDLVRAPFDLRRLVEGVVELLAPRAQGKGIEIAAAIEPDMPRLLLGDAERLRQIIVNLAGNAVKFTLTGGVGIIVSRSEAGEMVLRVRDTGPGIAHDAAAIIFEEFERGDASAQDASGAGLGLTITRGLVERMGGRVTLDSRPGHGATFEVTLPMEAAPGDMEVEEAAADLGRRRILIASTSPFEAPFLVDRLTDAGALAERVFSVAEAERALAAVSYDVVLADRALGEIATKRIAAAARRSGAMRTLVLLSPFERREFGPPEDAGFDGYLVKPVRPRSLLQQVSQQDTGDYASQTATPTERPTRDGVRVLLAEDNDINALVATRLIEKLGGLVERVGNGQSAVARALAEGAAFDAVILDIRMPVLDGLGAARAIRDGERRAGREPLMLIAATANVLPHDRAAAMEAGFDAFIPKPLDRAHLTELIVGLSRGERAKASA